MHDNDDRETIAGILDDYFDGLYRADVTSLRAIFHPDTVLKAPGLRRSLEQWLSLVSNRDIPMATGAPYRFRVLSLDIVGEQAMAKLECPLFTHNYIDFLGLLKENGRWRIVNKMYADINTNYTAQEATCPT